MDKIRKRLDLISKENRVGLMTHVLVGYPDLEKTREIILAMDRAGADFIELQIPFSDPIADGPVILSANHEALQSKVNLKDCLKIMQDLSGQTKAALIFMGYFNSILSFGVKKFLEKAKDSGASGLIFPDIPVDAQESKDFYEMSRRYDLASIIVVSPLTTRQRLKEVSHYATGLLYCVSNFGITGETDGLHEKFSNYLNQAREIVKLPLVVGWGIRSKEDIKKISPQAEVAIVGSEIIRRIDAQENFDPQEIEEIVRSYRVVR